MSTHLILLDFVRSTAVELLIVHFLPTACHIVLISSSLLSTLVSDSLKRCSSLTIRDAAVTHTIQQVKLHFYTI
jgi:hypothetical protein